MSFPAVVKVIIGHYVMLLRDSLDASSTDLICNQVTILLTLVIWPVMPSVAVE